MSFRLQPHKYQNTFWGNLKGSFKFYARKCYLFQNYKKVENIINKYPQCVNFFNSNLKHSNDILHRKYGCNAFSYKYGYECFDTTLYEVLSNFSDIFKKNYLICNLNEDFKVYLKSGSRMINEGPFTIFLSYKKTPFFDLNFIITKERDLLLTCIQGHLNTNEIVKIFTKEFFGMRPIGFLINFANIFKNFLTLNRLLGVNNNYLVSGFKRGKVRNKREFIINNYNQFWEENCEILNKYKGFWEIVPSRKNIDEIPSKKRSMYKKRFDMLDNLKIEKK